MKILWLRPSTGENVSVRRERIAEKLRERGTEVDILDASGADAITAVRAALVGDYDVIAGNVRMGLFVGYPLARILRKPFLGDVSDTLSDIEHLPSPLYRLLAAYEWYALKRAEAAVFVYESSYREALDRGVEHATKLPNAVEYNLFSSPSGEVVEEAKTTLEGSGVDLGKPVAIYIGILTPNYHIEDILKTAEATQDWEFVFVGEGELSGSVEQAADTLDNVYYPGSFEYRLMPGFLSHADAGFCFKNAEQPLKLKEYGAAGIPAVVQPGELEKYYGEDELVFVPPQPEEISAALRRIREGEERETAEKLQERVKSYSWDSIADGYQELFEDISG
jgi:glycosyltransferase involved in cell wall biosynthesis